VEAVGGGGLGGVQEFAKPAVGRKLLEYPASKQFAAGDLDASSEEVAVTA